MPTDIGKLNKKQGDPNVMALKEVNKIRILDRAVAWWHQHGINHPTDPEQFASVVCPGPRLCPLCRKPADATGNPRFQRSTRYAVNVWDYDVSQVKVLIGGPTIFREFENADKVGINPLDCDWTITKEGQRLNTKYHMIRHDASQFAHQVTPEQLHDVQKYEQPTTPETIFETLERFGIDYDSLETPSYTVQEALAFVMPYTPKHKGDTIEQMLDEDAEFAVWLHGQKLEQGQLGDSVFLALQTALEDRGLVPPLEEALAELPDPVSPSTDQGSAATDPPVGASSNVSAASASMVKLIGKDGAEVMVPPSAVDAMLAAGFSHPAPPAPTTSVDANAPTQVRIAGQVVELPREQALMLIDAGTAEQVDQAPEPEPEKPEPPLPLPDEVVQVDINGAQVPMPYIQAAAVVDTGAAKFVDAAVTQAHERVRAAGQAAEDEAGTVAKDPPDPEKPFVCPECSLGYKSKGALTQHVNKAHGAAGDPAPPAAPQSNGSGGVADRVRDKVAKAPFARDFDQLIRIFEEATGEKNFSNMTEEQLLKLEERIDQEVAAAE